MPETPQNHYIPTVMSPNASLMVGSAGGMNSAPPFLTNVTTKSKFRSALRRWIKMICAFAEADNKAKAMLAGAGHLIYMACDGTAQDMLQEAELVGAICLEGRADDPKRIKLVDEVLAVIAKETASEKVRKEVELLTEIHKCERRQNEDTSEFANRFTGAVARYANHMGGMSSKDSRQFAVLMVRNAMLSADTLNALTFQLTTSAGKHNPKAHIDVQLDVEAAQHLFNVLKKAQIEIGEASEEVNNRVKTARDLLCSVLSKATNESYDEKTNQNVMISMEDTSAAIRQIRIEPSFAAPFQSKPSMLGKRQFYGSYVDRAQHLKKMKSENACRVCGELGHWWKDKTEFREKFLAQRRQRDSKSNTIDEATHEAKDPTKPVDSLTEREKKQSASFFRQGGQ